MFLQKPATELLLFCFLSVTMTIFLNVILVVLENVSIAVFIGVLFAVGAMIAVEMTCGAPFSAFLGMVLSSLVFLGPLVILLIAIGSVFGLGMAF